MSGGILTADASPSSEDMDSTSNHPKRFSVGAGFNQGLEDGQSSNLLVAFGPSFNLSDRWSLWVDWGLWRINTFNKLKTILRVSTSAEYDMPVLSRLSLAPKAGVGILFTPPVFTANVGIRVYSEVSSRLTLFLEPGSLVWYRDSERRSNYLASPMYVLVGIVF